ncbi:MAG: response regulator receiver protein [Candidatus Sulfotelmatobacter sp.]|nr:response regulator receiver protein [Candidatus Sulfotelmatobacter sp.]
MARKILLADDSVTAQNMGRKILADAGYEVIAVNNGSAALKKIAELKPDLVILDVYMPGYSGLEVCQRLKESQETARIPVLLTVGKLEPFKPEEAQRVRAEGYIVKPFEASELLSALSKLEDKVVPRAEPSKPGRFARAMAAADDSDRNASSNTETGWKNRISFPHKKTEANNEENESQAAARSGADKKEKRQDPSPAPETHVDVAAFAPIGVPKEVTPAEVAAITTAAAQMQMAEAATKSGNQSSVTAPSGSPGEFAVEPSLERFQDDEIKSESGVDLNRPEEHKSAGPETGSVAQASSEVLATAVDHRSNGDSRNGNEKMEERQDAPITMAAASESAESVSPGSSRWTAVSVALESNETSIALEHEMQKAYAAFAAADYATAAGSVVAEAESYQNSAAQSATSIEESAAVISTSESTSVSQPETVPATASVDETQTSPVLAGPEAKVEPQPEFAGTAKEADVAGAASDSAVASETDSPVAQSATASDAYAPITDSSEPKLDSETVKTTAAAWASWRQIQDTSKGSAEDPQAHPVESAAPEVPSSDTAALAVAAGAEQALQEVASAAPTDSPADVASIVDSVLAGLRPKLMEEISRKMAEKK